jgi:Zn-dependent alcohol dehydrogenase
LAVELVHATTTIAVDLFDHKLEEAPRVGAAHLINAHQQGTLQVMMEMTGGCAVDLRHQTLRGVAKGCSGV